MPKDLPVKHQEQRFHSWLDNYLQSRSDEHLTRRLFHFLTGTVVAVLFAGFVSRKTGLSILGVITTLLIFMDLIRLKWKAFNNLVVKVLGPIMRKEEMYAPSAQLYYLLGLCFAVGTLPKVIAIHAIFTLAWLDPVAALIGVRFGRKTWRGFLGTLMGKRSKRMSIFLGAKTLEGSFAGFIMAFVAGVIAWTGPWAAVMVDGRLWWPDPEWVALMSFVGALTAMIAEAWPTQWDDNINIPFWTGLVLWGTAVLLNVPINFN